MAQVSSKNTVALYLWQSVVILLVYIAIKFVSVFLIFDFVDSSFSDPFLQIEIGELISNSIIYILFFICFRRWIFNRSKSYMPFPKFKVLFLILVSFLFLRIFQDPFFRLQNIINNDFPILENLERISIDCDVKIKILRIVLLQSIFEELLFRHIIFRGILNKYSNIWMAILTSSILFSISHLSWNNAIPTFLFGVFSAIVYYKTNNIFYSIFIHIISNIVWLIIFLDPKGYWQVLNYLNFGIFYWLLVAISIVVFYLSLKKAKLYKPIM